jgi:arylsulfatase
MRTVDEEFLDASLNFMEKAVKDNKPFFCWWNSTRMHIFTHLKKESEGKTGLGVYPDGMVEHDGHVGQLLDKLDQLGIADNTIVMYSTDNGAEVMSWPDGGTTPFRGEKATNFEGGWRVPCAIRWPGVIKPGTVSNEIFSHQDMLPTLAAAAGDPGCRREAQERLQVGQQDVRGAHRRLQPAPVPQGGGQGESAQGTTLLER